MRKKKLRLNRETLRNLAGIAETAEMEEMRKVAGGVNTLPLTHCAVSVCLEICAVSVRIICLE
jgi:hypothetical protein